MHLIVMMVCLLYTSSTADYEIIESLINIMDSKEEMR